MSSADERVMITLDLKNKTFVSGMKEAESAVDGLNDELEKTPAKSKNIEISFSSLKNKVVSLGKSFGIFDAANAGIAYNATIEQYQTSFEVLTGSAAKAAETVERLQAAAVNTPFEVSQLADTTQQLMNYGFTADDAINKTMMLGDISQGNADNMARLADVYMQISLAGKVSLGDIEQMIDAGFNPLQEIADSTGESMESLYERLSNGTVSVDEITASMERSTSEGGKYFGLMKEKSETLDGRFSALKTTVQEKLGGAFEGLSNFLRDTVIPVAMELLNNWEKYEPIFITLATIIGTLTAAYGLNAIGITTLTGATGIWAGISNLATGATSALSGAFGFLTSQIGLIVIAIGAIIAIGYLLVTHWDEVKAFALDVWNNIQAIFANFDAWLTNIFQTDWSQSFGILGEYMNSFFATISNVWDSIKSIFTGIIDFVAGVFTGDWTRVWLGVEKIFGGIFEGLKSLAKAPLNAIIGLINGMIEGINWVIDKINSISVDLPDWLGGAHIGFDLPRLSKIRYLLHGTSNWQGGFARMNEGGRGELTYLPNGTQVIPHDISVKYAQESARLQRTSEPIDLSGILEGIAIHIDNSTNVDGTPLYQKSSEYTLRRMGNQYRAVLATKGI